LGTLAGLKLQNIHGMQVVCCGVLQRVAVCCSVLQCVAVCCSVLQCVAVCCSVLRVEIAEHPWHAGMYVYPQYATVVQWVAACCSVLQRVAVYSTCARLHVWVGVFVFSTPVLRYGFVSC